jgi:hypothetical protein
MTAEEEIAQLKKELAAERAKSARLEGELARIVAWTNELFIASPGYQRLPDMKDEEGRRCLKKEQHTQVARCRR